MARSVRLFHRRGHYPVGGMGGVSDGEVDRVVVDTEAETWSNCWLWALSRWLKYGGTLVVEDSPVIPVWRAMWAPNGVGKGPLYHFHPTHPKRGIKGIWAAFWHKGKPRNMRPRWDD